MWHGSDRYYILNSFDQNPIDRLFQGLYRFFARKNELLVDLGRPETNVHTSRKRDFFLSAYKTMHYACYGILQDVVDYFYVFGLIGWKGFFAAIRAGCITISLR